MSDKLKSVIATASIVFSTLAGAGAAQPVPPANAPELQARAAAGAAIEKQKPSRIVFFEGGQMNLPFHDDVVIPVRPDITRISVGDLPANVSQRRVDEAIEGAVQAGERPVILFAAHGLPDARFSNDGRLTLLGHVTGLNDDNDRSLRFVDTWGLARQQLETYEGAYGKRHPGEAVPPLQMIFGNCFSSNILASIPPDMMGRLDIMTSDSDGLPGHKQSLNADFLAAKRATPEEGFIQQLLRYQPPGIGNGAIPSAVFNDRKQGLLILDGRALADKVTLENLEEMRAKALDNIDKVPVDLRWEAQRQIMELATSDLKKPGWNKYNNDLYEDHKSPRYTVPSLVGYLADYDHRYSSSLAPYRDRNVQLGYYAALQNYFDEGHTDAEVKAQIGTSLAEGWDPSKKTGFEPRLIKHYIEAGLKRDPASVDHKIIGHLLDKGVSPSDELLLVLGSSSLDAKQKTEVTKVFLAHDIYLGQQNAQNQTLIMLASSASFESLQLILDATAKRRGEFVKTDPEFATLPLEVNARDDRGRTALIHLAQSKLPPQEALKMAEALVGAGADLRTKDINGQTALDYIQAQEGMQRSPVGDFFRAKLAEEERLSLRGFLSRSTGPTL
jgi:hypothetical protein